MKKLLSLFTALVLCTAMWGATTYATFYKVQGALYQGINVDFTTNKNMFAPNGASVTYTTFDGQPADWYSNGNPKKSGSSFYTASNLADGNYYKYQITNYTGYDAQDPKIDYIYGTSSSDYLLRAGSGTMYMMSMANAYCVCTESTTASNVGKYYVDNKSMLTLTSTDAATYETSMKYGTNFSYAKNGGLIFAYEMLVDNPGEMYIDYIVLPIFGYPKTDATTIAKMIPEGKKLTLTLYPIDLTLGNDGIYTYTRKTPSITTVTATAENFKQGDKVYDGTVMFDLKDKPVLISGDFVARLTWDEGCDFGLITDDNNLQNFTTFYLWKDDKGSITKSYMWKSSSANASISYHAMFPVLEKKDDKSELEFASTGEESKEVAIKSNIDPADTENFRISYSGDGADWISSSFRYTTEGKYVAKETVYVKFTAQPNTTGKTRKATITLKHHGKELKYTVSQESMPSAFYEVPTNAFFAGMTETGDTAAECKTFYLPYNYGQEYTFTSTEAGTWTSDGGGADESNKNYSYSNRTMKDSCHTPLFAVDGKVGYQYGASGESFDEKLYFHIGDSVMHYMTPARLYGEYGKPTHYLSVNYKTSEKDTVGVYFNNDDVMYIDGISIPIKNSVATKADEMFPTGAHVIVNIYKATSAGGKGENKVDRDIQFYTDTLTIEDFKVRSDEPNRGALNKKFREPISIEGPFVVELRDMKHSGCSFTIYSSTEREGENMWGYFFNKGSRTFPGNYTPLISVHAMFPVLYGKSGEDLTIDTIPVTGSTFGDEDCPTRTIYANVKYNKLDEDGWSREHKVSGVTMNFYKNDRTDESTKWYFVMSPNTSGAVREGDIIFNLRGKKLAYHVTQAAPTLTPREGMEQYFVMSLQDDTVHNTKGDKVTKVYLESEVSLEDTIKVVSKKGLTKIDKTFGNKDGKYYVCLTFTRAKCALTDTEDIITVSFEKNANNKYEYTILHKAAGKLRPDTTCRTFVVGPKGGKALFLNDDNTVGDRYVRLYSDVPASNTKAYYYKKDFFKIVYSYFIDAEGNHYTRVSASVEGETTVERLDSFYMCLPNCDTIKFYVRQETTPRVWRHNTTQLTQLEVNNQGGLAHFKGFLTQKVTIVSNTPGTLDIDEVEIAFSDGAEKWITPDKTVNSTGDSVFITFDVSPLTGTEPRSTDITVSILDNEFTVPLTQKTFGIEWSNNGYEEELVVPVAGGIANWKGSYYPYLNVFGTEAYRDSLLKVTAPEGVEITRQTDTLTTGRQATYITFSKKDTLTADWSGEITVSFDSINTEENFEYHFSKTFTITQAAAKMWYDANQSEELSFAAEDEKSEDIKVWANFPFSTASITFYTTYSTDNKWFTIQPKQDNAIKDGDNYYYLFYIKANANTEEERSGSVYVALRNKTEIKTTTLSFTQLAPEPAPTYIREGSVGNYGTLCFPYTPTQEVTGADFYKVLWFNEPAMDLVLEKITSQPEAGVPYIFQYTADQMVWTYDNTKDPEDISEDGVNGLHGVALEEGYTVSEEDAIAGTYLLSNNQIVKAAATSHAAQYRAYLRLNEVSTEAPVGPVTAPRIHMIVPGNGAPTNLNGLNSNTKAYKVLKDGQLLIIRDTKTYNAQGQIIR